VRIAVVDETRDPRIPGEELRRVVAALGRQAGEHYAPFWQSAPVDIYLADSLARVGANDSVIALLRDADQAGVLGYHTTAPDGRPYGRVFTRPIFENGGTLLSGANAVSVTLSHEYLETMGDPYVSWWADTPDGDEEALELCDRVEGDAYEIDGVSVSNFLGPRAFAIGSAGPFDWMRRLTSAWFMTPGGYCIRRTGGPTGEVRDVFGAEFPEWKRALKAHPAARSARRRAEGGAAK
jgi:hypothetical protein